MNKLIDKLRELVESAQIKFYNGHQIKRCSFGDFDMKSFQVNKVKYKIGLSVERKCNNTTLFIPSEPIIQLIDYRDGTSYEGKTQISMFLNCTEKDIEILFQPMIFKTLYNLEEISETQKEYTQAMKFFCEAFLI